MFVSNVSNIITWMWNVQLVMNRWFTIMNYFIAIKEHLCYTWNEVTNISSVETFQFFKQIVYCSNRQKSVSESFWSALQQQWFIYFLPKPQFSWKKGPPDRGLPASRQLQYLLKFLRGNVTWSWCFIDLFGRKRMKDESCMCNECSPVYLITKMLLWQYDHQSWSRRCWSSQLWKIFWFKHGFRKLERTY